MSTKYHRILLKLSGEQLAGKHEFGIDPEVAKYLAGELAKVQSLGVQVAIIVGGGNMVRGAAVASEIGIKRVTADQMGMLSGLMNAMALTDIFESEGLQTRCLSHVFVEQLAENYTHRLAEKHLENGRILLIAGGTGRPYSTHDTAAVLAGLELQCDLVLKATKVEGVFDKDPAIHADAKLHKHIPIQQAVESSDIKVMDQAALGLALEHGMNMVIFDASKADNLVKIVQGESVGTTVN